jgi:sugar/nucleoside kinase (ribokinase family)
MTPESPSRALDLLIVGGLTVDRFADGSSAPGGSVLHAARAVTHRGHSLGVVTAAGPEPEARRGLAELRQRCALVEVAVHPATATFRHAMTGNKRRLWLERAGGPVALDPGASGWTRSAAVLYAPIAGEVSGAALRASDGGWHRVAILQGWLRSTATGEVDELSLTALDGEVVSALATCDVLVASRDDLLADADEPQHQLDALREWFGHRPVLVVTDGVEGLWLDVVSPRPASGGREHLPVPYVVEDPTALGAGDVLAAFLALGGTGNGEWRKVVAKAMLDVAETLSARH